MLVLLKSGRRLEIASHHTVFHPVGAYHEGDFVDPVTVAFECEKAALYLRCGVSIIVDNVIEVVQQVLCPACAAKLACDDFQKVDLNENTSLCGSPSAPPYRRTIRAPAVGGGRYQTESLEVRSGW